MRKTVAACGCRTGTYFCVDKSVTSVVIKVSAADTPSMLSSLYHKSFHHIGDVQGLAEHRDELGAPLCPCRHYDDKAAEAKQGFWNCPCVPMRERKVHGLLARSTLHMHCTVHSDRVLQH